MLLVPIHLDAFLLKIDQPVLNAKADFTRLPYTNGTQDVNGDVAYISEEIISEPFQDQGLYLKAGIHLHWALPDALTKAVRTSSGTDFPDVPNRWLIIRSYQKAERTIVSKWIVESDYLYPQGVENIGSSISYPVIPAPSKGCPFRFLGRKMPLSAWHPKDTNAEYLNKLTAVGYGEPTFAAFYPNCQSVFGFHDDEFTKSLPNSLQYDIIGWYSDASKDCLRKSVIASNNIIDKQNLIKLIEKELKWTTSLTNDQEFPDRTLFYTRMAFNSAADSVKNVSVDISIPVITVANTGTEALSAYLANDISPILKSQIEDQLEALSFSSLINSRQLDVGPKFQEARHEKGFSTVSGGTTWIITPRNLEETSADSTQANLQTKIILPGEIAHQLSIVNHFQKEYDRSLEESESLRRQIFSDWYKYMICAYPPDDDRNSYPNIDEVRNFIEVKGIASLQNKTDIVGDLKLQTDDNGNITCALSTPSDSLAAKLADTLNNLFEAVKKFNDRENVKNANVFYILKTIPAQRYYQPNDPVILLTGAAVAPTLRHGRDGRLREDDLLECQILPETEIEKLILENTDVITGKIEEIKNQNGDNIAFSTWTKQPWNPFLLEWEAEIFPIENHSNLNSRTAAYQADFINDNFILKENDVDFSVVESKGKIAKAANVYSGTSILTPYAGIQLTTQIEAFLLQNYYESNQIPANERSDDYFIKNRKTILNWYEKNCKAVDISAVCNIYRAYSRLTAEDFYALSQSLGGFNEALLMHKQTMQLDVADPLGFDDYRPFADAVKDAVRQSVISAPQPLNDFNPVRSGALKLLRLRLVDTFGQFLDLNCEKVITTEQLNVSGSHYKMTLPPRLTQPARINFRWLSASEDDLEMNDHPATSPICGWILPNNLDNSLMIYDDGGKALGSISQQNKWQPTPGDDDPIDAANIQNPHLRKIVGYLLDSGRTFLQSESEGRKFLSDFLSALDNALENIEPENFAQHQDIALLMGSPIAVVRATVDLEIQGLPAVHQGWNVFRQDLRRNSRDTDDFDQIEFPIRIGEYRQFNDGIIGYWKETDDGYEGNIFYAPQSNEIANEFIKTHQDDPMTIYQAVTKPRQTLTILMDPRGSIHATSGILPVKSINLPPVQFTDALKNIEITFLSMPILTDFSKLRLPLPSEPGFEWSWLQNIKGSWTEITTPGIIKKQVFIDVFTDGEIVWETLKTAGWIEQSGNSKSAVIVSRDKRKKVNLEGALAALTAQIESLLDQAQIGITDTSAKFSGKQKILEGWLKLSKEKTKD